MVGEAELAGGGGAVGADALGVAGGVALAGVGDSDHRLDRGEVGGPDLLVQMADETVGLVDRLESMKGVQPYLERIDRLESEGDAVYRRTVARLFSGEFEALDVLRWKDIVEAMEAALNTIEDISNVVEAIVLKHA